MKIITTYAFVDINARHCEQQFEALHGIPVTRTVDGTMSVNFAVHINTGQRQQKFDELRLISFTSHIQQNLFFFSSSG